MNPINNNPKEIHHGENIHHHDHVAIAPTLASFNKTKITTNKVVTEDHSTRLT